MLCLPGLVEGQEVEFDDLIQASIDIAADATVRVRGPQHWSPNDL